MRLPAEQRRELLAQAAVRVITRDGVSAATVRTIAAEAGMSLASVHYAYESRDELLRAAIGLVIEEERAVASGPLDLPDDLGLQELLRLGLEAYLGLVRADPAREQGMLELTLHALRRPELAPVAHEQYASYYELVTGLLTEVGRRTQHGWAVPLPVLARWVIGFTDGLTMQWLVAPDEAAVQTQLDLMAAALAAHAVPGETPSATPGDKTDDTSHDTAHHTPHDT